MLALRQGAARLAPRQAQAIRTTRRYASGGSHHAPEVNEPIGVSDPDHDGRGQRGMRGCLEPICLTTGML